MCSQQQITNLWGWELCISFHIHSHFRSYFFIGQKSKFEQTYPSFDKHWAPITNFNFQSRIAKHITLISLYFFTTRIYCVASHRFVLFFNQVVMVCIVMGSINCVHGWTIYMKKIFFNWVNEKINDVIQEFMLQEL
jgi:hypothetical protein